MLHVPTRRLIHNTSDASDKSYASDKSFHDSDISFAHLSCLRRGFVLNLIQDLYMCNTNKGKYQNIRYISLY